MQTETILITARVEIGYDPECRDEAIDAAIRSIHIKTMGTTRVGCYKADLIDTRVNQR